MGLPCVGLGKVQYAFKIKMSIFGGFMMGFEDETSFYRYLQHSEVIY